MSGKTDKKVGAAAARRSDQGAAASPLTDPVGAGTTAPTRPHALGFAKAKVASQTKGNKQKASFTPLQPGQTIQELTTGVELLGGVAGARAAPPPIPEAKTAASQQKKQVRVADEPEAMAPPPRAGSPVKTDGRPFATQNPLFSGKRAAKAELASGGADIFMMDSSLQGMAAGAAQLRKREARGGLAPVSREDAPPEPKGRFAGAKRIFGKVASAVTQKTKGPAKDPSVFTVDNPFLNSAATVSAPEAKASPPAAPKQRRAPLSSQAATSIQAANTSRTAKVGEALSRLAFKVTPSSQTKQTVTNFFSRKSTPQQGAATAAPTPSSPVATFDIANPLHATPKGAAAAQSSTPTAAPDQKEPGRVRKVLSAIGSGAIALGGKVARGATRGAAAIGTVAACTVAGSAAIPIPILGTAIGFVGGIAAARKVDQNIAATFQKSQEAKAAKAQAASQSTPSSPPAKDTPGQSAPAPSKEKGQSTPAPSASPTAPGQTGPDQQQGKGKGDEDDEKPKDKTFMDSVGGLMGKIQQNPMGTMIAIAVCLLVPPPAGPLLAFGALAGAMGMQRTQDKAENSIANAKFEMKKAGKAPAAAQPSTPGHSQAQAREQTPAHAPDAPANAAAPTVAVPTIQVKSPPAPPPRAPGRGTPPTSAPTVAVPEQSSPTRIPPPLDKGGSALTGPGAGVPAPTQARTSPPPPPPRDLSGQPSVKPSPAATRLVATTRRHAAGPTSAPRSPSPEGGVNKGKTTGKDTGISTGK